MTVHLTRQQAVILPLLAEGLTVPEIAAHIYLSPFTVKTHVAGLREKLGAPTIGAVVHRAHILGLLDGRTSRLTPEQKLTLINRWVVDPDVARLVAAERSQS